MKLDCTVNLKLDRCSVDRGDVRSLHLEDAALANLRLKGDRVRFNQSGAGFVTQVASVSNPGNPGTDGALKLSGQLQVQKVQDDISQPARSAIRFHVNHHSEP